MPIKQHLSITSSSQSLSTTILLSLSMNMTALGTSYKWNYTVFVCDWHISVSILFLKVHACCNRCQDSLPFQGWIIFHCMVLAYILSIYIFVQAYILSVYIFVIHWWIHGHRFCLLSIINNATVNIGVQTLLWGPIFNSLDIGPEVGFLDHMVNSVLKYLRNHHTVSIGLASFYILTNNTQWS